MEPFSSPVLVFPPPKHAAAGEFSCGLVAHPPYGPTCQVTRGAHPAAPIGPRRDRLSLAVMRALLAVREEG
jgi:hypothetical protein